MGPKPKKKRRRLVDSNAPTATAGPGDIPLPPALPPEAADMPGIDVPIEWDEEEPITSLRPSSIPPPIARVGRFDILGRLAIGGMAEIYLAREAGQEDTTRLLVVKFMRTSLGPDPSIEEMFLREARVVMHLSHPNICHVYEVGKEGGRHFIAMEWVHGVTLRDLHKQAHREGSGVPIAVAVKIIAMVAEALEFAHRARDRHGKPLGIVHRDVSPHNVMISYDGVVKLLDFGVAKVQASMTQSGTLKGKFGYMSPQQAMGQPVDGRSDIFSLGIVLFELLTGQRMYKTGSEYETLKAIVEQPVRSAREANPEVPEELDRILSKAMAKTPDQRYRTAGEMQQELEVFLAENRQVVNAARLAGLMREVYGDKANRKPELDRSEEVSGSFTAPLQPLAIPVDAPGAPAKKSHTRTFILAALAMAALVLIVGAVVGLATSASEQEEYQATELDPRSTEPETVEPEEPVEPAAAPTEQPAPEETVAADPDEPAEAPEEAPTVEAAEPEEDDTRREVAARRQPAASDESPMRVTSSRRESETMRGSSMRRGRFVTSPF